MEYVAPPGLDAGDIMVPRVAPPATNITPLRGLGALIFLLFRGFENWEKISRSGKPQLVLLGGINRSENSVGAKYL